jgi:hypothetical protein
MDPFPYLAEKLARYRLLRFEQDCVQPQVRKLAGQVDAHEEALARQGAQSRRYPLFAHEQEHFFVDLVGAQGDVDGGDQSAVG